MKTGILSAFLIALSGIAFSGDDGKEVSGKWLFDDPENFLGSSVNRQELRGYASPAKGIVGGDDGGILVQGGARHGLFPCRAPPQQLFCRQRRARLQLV